MRTPCIVYIATLALFALASACKSAEDTKPTPVAALPATFSGQADTASTATVPWRDFFPDKHLVALIDTALHNNWDVQIAFQRIAAAQADVLLSRGDLRPQLSAIAAMNQRKFGLYTMDGSGNITTEIEPGRIVPTHLRDYYPGLQASWEVDVWGRLRNQKRAAVNRFLASVEGRTFVTTTLIADVANAYYELIALDNELSVLHETVTLQQNAFELVKVQREVGAANQLAVSQFEAQLLATQALQVEARQNIIEQESRLNFLLGRYPQPIARDTAFTNQQPPTLSAGIPSGLLAARPDIRQAEFELRASRADVRAARAAFYPTLTLDGSIGFQAYKPNLLFKTPESYVYGLFGSLTAPLINRAAIRSQFRAANARQTEALYQYQKTVANGFVEVYNQLAGLRNLQEIQTLKTQEVRAVSQSIETSGELFRTGRANYLDVIVAQQNALSAKLELVNVKKRQLQTSVELYKALGGGWQ